MSLEESRVVEVFAPAPAAGEDSFGSGYLVSGGLVLTARPVVEGTSRVGCADCGDVTVRGGGGGEFLTRRC